MLRWKKEVRRERRSEPEAYNRFGHKKKKLCERDQYAMYQQ
jgi:hypothetical protein